MHRFAQSLIFVIATLPSLALSETVKSKEAIPPSCHYGTPSPTAAPEFEQFAFLIGDYSVEPDGWFQGAWHSGQVPIPARWNGHYGLDGLSIVDELFSLDPGIEPTTGRGVNVRLFDPESEEWKMMWISTTTMVVQDLRAKMIDGKLTMWQVTPARPDFKAVFEVVDKDHWHRIHYEKDESGNWLPKYRLNATRIACPAKEATG